MYVIWIVPWWLALLILWMDTPSEKSLKREAEREAAAKVAQEARLAEIEARNAQRRAIERAERDKFYNENPWAYR